MVMSKTEKLQWAMESAGFSSIDGPGPFRSATVWRKPVRMPSLRPGARALAVVTVVPSSRFQGEFTFKTDLLLDDVPLHEKYCVPIVQSSLEEFLLSQVPTFGTLFECEDFYVRKHDHPGVLTDEGTSQEILLQLLLPDGSGFNE